MKGRVEFDLVESIGMVVAEMVDDRGRDLDALRLDVVKHAESGVRMLGHDPSLLRDFVGVVVGDHQPVGEVERTNAETPTEGAFGHLPVGLVRWP